MSIWGTTTHIGVALQLGERLLQQGGHAWEGAYERIPHEAALGCAGGARHGGLHSRRELLPAASGVQKIHNTVHCNTRQDEQ
jgi:hypothetical protein